MAKSRFVQALKPWHFTALLLIVQGATQGEAAKAVGKSRVAVNCMVDSPLGKATLEGMRMHTLDTMREVATAAQAHAPEMIERLVAEARGALESSSRVRAQKTLLEIAGHTPVHHMVVERPDAIEEEFKGLTDADIKDKILGRKSEKGPDGKMLS